MCVCVCVCVCVCEAEIHINRVDAILLLFKCRGMRAKRNVVSAVYLWGKQRIMCLYTIHVDIYAYCILSKWLKLQAFREKLIVPYCVVSCVSECIDGFY